MIQVSVTTCKLTFLMLAVLVAPFIAECDYIMNVWLEDVPNYTTQFVQLFLLGSLLRQLYTGVSIGIESVGSIKYLQIFVGGLHFFVLPVAYLLLRLNCGVLSVFYMLLCEELLCLVLTVIISKSVTGLDIKKFVYSCIVPCIMTFISTYTLCHLSRCVVHKEPYRLFLLCLISIVSTSILSYVYVFDKKERAIVKSYVTLVLNRFKRIKRIK